MPDVGPPCIGSDWDADGVPDICDKCQGFDDQEDLDGDGFIDGCDNCALPNPSQADCQGNGTGDACDIDDGTSLDIDGNGVPDECQPYSAAMVITPSELEINLTSSTVGEFAVRIETDMPLWNAFDILVSSPDLSPVGFDYNNGLITVFGTNVFLDPFATGENVALLGGQLGNSFPGSLDLGTLEIDASGLEAGVYTFQVGSPDDGVSHITYAPDKVPVAGSATVSVFYDCNDNGMPDHVEIADGVTPDTNGNGIPDDCDPDCNKNGIPDHTEIADGTSPDENRNGIPDDCDPSPPGADDRFDIHGNKVPCVSADEECHAGVSGPAPSVYCRDTNGDRIPDGCYVARQRYLSILPSQRNKGRFYAYRISLDTGTAGVLPLGFATLPSLTSVPGPGPAFFRVSRIEETPIYLDWTMLTQNYLAIGDCEISPGRTYLLQTIFEGDDPADEGSYSFPLSIPTVKTFGDVANGSDPEGPSDGVVSIVDIYAIILGFGNQQRVLKDRLDLEPITGSAVPNLSISLADAFAAVQAFQGAAYFGPTPDSCP